MPGWVAVVTDSAAHAGAYGDLDSEEASATAASATAVAAGSGPVVVVPLRLLAGAQVADDTSGPLPGPIAAEVARGERLTTSRPAPERFAAAYVAAAAAGAPAVVSIHLSGELSGTIGSARLAAATAPVPVHVVDSRSIGAGLSMIVRAAARAAAAGQSGEQVERAATRRAALIGVFFALDSQDQLRAGGRLGAPPGAVPPGAGAGSLLRSRPLLRLAAGRIVVLERVRTRSAARERLAELAAGFAAGRPAELAVQHIGNPAGADDLRRQLAAAIPAIGPITVTQAGAAILAHAGPGLLAVAVAPSLS